MNKTLIAAMALAAIWPTNVLADEYFAVTPSRATETHFGEPPTEVVGKLSAKCIDMGWSIVSSGSTEVVCEAPLNFGQSVLGQALLGNSYSTPPRRFFKYNISTVQGISRAQASGWMEVQMAFGQIRRTDFSGPEFHNSAMNVMAAAGGKLPRGTSFPNHAYLGVGWQPTGQGREATFAISEIEEGSPAQIAGLQVGDQIKSIARKRLKAEKDYLDIAAKAGDMPEFEVEFVRAGKPMKVMMQRRFRPTIQEAVTARAAPPLPVTVTNQVTQPTISVADELAKLLKLKESGVINQAEFDAQKTKLLNR